MEKQNKERKKNRLKFYDYSQSGYYFVTICTKNHKEFFGEIKNNEMVLNIYGEIIKQQWMWLKQQYDYVILDEFIVMPNHIHGILVIENKNICRDRSRPVPTRKIKSLSELIGAFKTTSSKLIHKNGSLEFQWQRSFYDHIIRNEKSLNNIRAYILDNPLKWELDRNNKEDIFIQFLIIQNETVGVPLVGTQSIVKTESITRQKWQPQINTSPGQPQGLPLHRI